MSVADPKLISLCPLLFDIGIEDFLVNELKISKSQIKKNLSNQKLKKIISPNSEITLPIDLINYGKINPNYSGPNLETIFEDENFLVIDKKVRVHSQPLFYSDTINSLSFLSQKERWDILNVNPLKMDRGLINRLDFETSGVLIFAKKNEVYLETRSKFNEVTHQKIYFAVVKNKFDLEGRHVHYLEPHLVKGKKMRVSESSNLKAELSIKLIEYVKEKNLSLLEITLITGVRHQIRAQLSALQFPILGDTLYGGESNQRLFLHAYNYKLTYQQKLYDWIAKIPIEFIELLSKNK